MESMKMVKHDYRKKQDILRKIYNWFVVSNIY